MEGITLEEFTEAEDEACKQLEVTASQFHFFGGLIKAAMTHHGLFDSKPRQFSDHVVLVAKLPDGKVCGVVCAAIKRANVHGREQLCGFVFDLRVAEQFQRRRIGVALTRAVEAACAARGVSFLYLSVNNSNDKARALYAREHWVVASRRALVMRPLLFAPATPPAVSGSRRVRELPRAEALRLLQSHFAQRDLGLSASEFERLTASECMIGTFFASDGDSHAALSLWHGSSFTTFQPINFVLPVRLWVRIGPLAACASACALIRIAWALCNAVSARPWLQAVAAGVCLAVGACGAAFMRWVGTRTALRARAFAPIYAGTDWQPLMRAVHARVCTEARARGFGLMIINEDVSSPLIKCLHEGQAPRSPTMFWQKALRTGTEQGPPLPAAGGTTPLPALQSDMFFDPRDI